MSRLMGPLDKAIDEETTQQRIDQLRQSLHRLGTVHLGVLEEHKEQQERYDFLRQQRDDLVIAAEDLKKTLSLIDRTARRMFLKSFEQIRETFKGTFVRFFPGGEADLRLEENIDAPRGPHRHHRPPPRQAPAKHYPAVGRRAGTDGHLAALCHLPSQAQPVLHPRRGSMPHSTTPTSTASCAYSRNLPARRNSSW